MYDGGFDGLDLVALAVRDAAPLVELYHTLLGFEVTADEKTAAGVAELLGCQDVSRVVHLSRGTGVGGEIVLLEVAAAPQLDPASVGTARPGVYALDFYLRDAAATEATIEKAGWRFISPAVHYDLPGTVIPVRERMLVQPHSGLVHAMVQHRPGGTRSVLGTNEDGWCSEVVAVVVLTGNLPGARAFASEVLGGQEYFNGTFAGPAIEEMLRFGPREGLEASLYRGPTSRNARLEFARPVDGEGRPLPLTGEAPGSVLPGMLVHDLDGLLRRLAEGAHGAVGADLEVDWPGGPRRAVRFATAYDVTLLLLDGGTTA